MAKQIIQTGAIANDKTGDPLRTAFTKINQNFTELYDANEALVIPVDISDLTDTEGLLGGNVNTGDVTFDGVKIIGAGEDSGDGNGYATLELVPDADLYINGQYIVVDPTAPNHIHIRAGGVQDQSPAELFLGGENNHVRVTDGNGVNLQHVNITDDFHYYDQSEFGFSDGTWFTEDGNHYIQFQTTNPIMVSHFWDFTNGTPNQIVAYWDDGSVSEEVEFGGWAGNVEPNVYKVQVIQPPPTNPTALFAIEFHIFTTSYNYLRLENNDFNLEVGDDIRMYSRDRFRLYNYSTTQPIEITTDWDNSGHTWAFKVDGDLQLPENGDIVDSDGNSVLQYNKTVETVSTSTPTVITTDVVFADPNAAGGAVNLLLPSSPVVGKVITVKNINSGGNSVYIQTDGFNSMEIENGTIGNSGVYATIPDTGTFITWVFDGSTYRIIG